MRIGSGSHTYQFIDHWADIPDTESSRTGWAHHGGVVSETGSVIDVRGEVRRYCAGHRFDIRVVGHAPEEGSGWPSHAQPTNEPALCARSARNQGPAAPPHH